MHMIEDGSDGLLIFESDVTMTKEGTDQVFEAFDRAVEKHGKVNLMVRVKDYEGFDLSSLGDRGPVTAKFGAIGKAGHYAAIGAPRGRGRWSRRWGRSCRWRSRTSTPPMRRRPAIGPGAADIQYTRTATRRNLPAHAFV